VQQLDVFFLLLLFPLPKPFPLALIGCWSLVLSYTLDDGSIIFFKQAKPVMASVKCKNAKYRLEMDFATDFTTIS